MNRDDPDPEAKQPFRIMPLHGVRRKHVQEDGKFEFFRFPAEKKRWMKRP
jgi:hypothetical protein